MLIFPDNSFKIVVLSEGKRTVTKYGVIHHDDIVKLKKFGSVIKSSSGAEVLVQKPTISDIVYNLFKRRSQVIYDKDVHIMIGLSGITKGSRVGEAGVGSGFLTAHLLNVIGNEGKYFGFEVRQDMKEITVKNLKLLGYNVEDSIKITDVREGIDVTELDAFFLDIPDPWNAIESIYNALSGHGRLIVFVPTSNQVIKLLSSDFLKRHFSVYSIVENMQREYMIDSEAFRPKNIQTVFTGYVLALLKKLT